MFITSDEMRPFLSVKRQITFEQFHNINNLGGVGQESFCFKKKIIFCLLNYSFFCLNSFFSFILSNYLLVLIFATYFNRFPSIKREQIVTNVLGPQQNKR